MFYFDVVSLFSLKTIVQLHKAGATNNSNTFFLIISERKNIFLDFIFPQEFLRKAEV